MAAHHPDLVDRTHRLLQHGPCRLARCRLRLARSQHQPCRQHRIAGQCLTRGAEQTGHAYTLQRAADFEQGNGHRERCQQQCRRARGDRRMSAGPAAESHRHRNRSGVDRLPLAHATELVGEIERRAVATTAIALHRRQGHDAEIATDMSPEPTAVHRLIEDGSLEGLLRRTAERPLECERLEQCDAQRVHVDETIDWTAAGDQLRSHVGGRSQSFPGAGQHGILGFGRAHETEVEHDRFVVRLHHDVARLDVAVDETLLVRDVDRAGDLLDHFDHEVGSQAERRQSGRPASAFLRDARRQRRARNELHRVLPATVCTVGNPNVQARSSGSAP